MRLRFFAPGLALLLLCAVPLPADSPVRLLTSRASEKAKPWVPGWGFYPRAPQVWLRYHHHLQQQSRRGKAQIVFVGDSLTLEWADRGKGQALWHTRYAPLQAVNYGIGGDTTRQALWRIQQGELDGLHPKVIVLMIGTDNFNDPGSDGTDDEIAQGIAAVVHALRRRLPQTKILLLGLLPRQETSFCRRVRGVNRTLPALDDGLQVRYLDMGSRFLLAPGRINFALYTSDQLHLTPAGYQTWADAMQPLLNEMVTLPLCPYLRQRWP